MQCASTHAYTRSIKPHPNSRQRPVHKAGIRIQDVLVELGQRGVEVGRVPEFHGKAVNLRLCVSKSVFVVGILEFGSGVRGLTLFAPLFAQNRLNA